MIGVNRFFRFVKKYPSAVTATTVSFVGSTIGAMFSVEPLTYRMGVLTLDAWTNENIQEVDAHNEKHSEDLWEYEHYSLEDAINNAELGAIIILILAVLITVGIFTSMGWLLDSNDSAVVPPPPARASHNSTNP